PGNPPGAALRGTARACVEPASMIAPGVRGTTMKSRRLVLGTVLALIGLPMVLALLEAVSYHVLNRSNGTLVSSGQTREYLLYVPKSYDPSKPAPLVISMHGAGLWGAAQMQMSRWDKVADQHGIIVVCPSGSGVPRIWHMDRGKDVRFISEL